jgi:hypothetical protein
MINPIRSVYPGSESQVGAGLAGEVPRVLGQGEGLLEVIDGLGVAAHAGTGAGEAPVGQGLGSRVT